MPIEAEAAAALTDTPKGGAVGRIVSRILRPGQAIIPCWGRHGTLVSAAMDAGGIPPPVTPKGARSRYSRACTSRCLMRYPMYPPAPAGAIRDGVSAQISSTNLFREPFWFEPLFAVTTVAMLQTTNISSWRSLRARASLCPGKSCWFSNPSARDSVPGEALPRDRLTYGPRSNAAVRPETLYICWPQQELAVADIVNVID